MGLVVWAEAAMACILEALPRATYGAAHAPTRRQLPRVDYKIGLNKMDPLRIRGLDLDGQGARSIATSSYLGNEPRGEMTITPVPPGRKQNLNLQLFHWQIYLLAAKGRVWSLEISPRRNI